jgi:hypothetical protein
MSQMDEVDLAHLTNRIDAALAGEEFVFSSLFRSVYFALKWDERVAAEKMDCSIPLVKRWFSGKVTPPAWKIVLKLLREEIEKAAGPNES